MLDQAIADYDAAILIRPTSVTALYGRGRAYEMKHDADRAIADYGPDEIRLMRRCQVMATKVFDPAFLRPAREAARVTA